MTRWLPRSSASARSTTSRLSPCAWKIFFSDGAAVVEQAEQQMLGADVIVLELAGLGLRGIQRLLQVRAEKQVAAAGALDFVAAGQFAFQVRLELRGRHADLLQQLRDEALGLADQGQQQMLAIHLLMRMSLRDALRFLQRLLRLDGQPVQLHEYEIDRR